MRNLKNLIPYVARYKVFFITGILVLLLLSSVTLVQPYLIRLGIDSLQANKFEPLISVVIVLVGLVQFLGARMVGGRSHVRLPSRRDHAADSPSC